MATWSTRAAVRGRQPRGDSPPSSPSSSSPPATPSGSPSPFPSPYPPDSPMGGSDSMEDSGFIEFMEVQLGATGDMGVVERLQYLLDTGQFADVNVRVGQGAKVAVFKAHRLLLATASQPLYKLVQAVNPHPSPADITTIRLTDMQPSHFKHVLRYIYTDTLDCENMSVAFEMLRASRRWGLAGLGIKSLTFLEEFVDNFNPAKDEDKDNLFDLLVLSEGTLGELNEKCWRLLTQHADTLVPSQGFITLEKPMAVKVLTKSDLKVADQLMLFKAIRDWGLRHLERHNLKLSHLAEAVEELLPVVDFEKISDEDFLGSVLTSECLGKAEVIAFFMSHNLPIPRALDFNNNKQLPFWLHLCASADKNMRLPQPLSDPPILPSLPPTSSPSSPSSPLHQLSVNESTQEMGSLTQEGGSEEYHKVCRFKKGYRCPPKEIYQEHELRFRVDRTIQLVGVGCGFLFTPTNMGINLHCQGPWETRQWSDISQAYCRVAGEKKDTADIHLMFLKPVRIEADQSYKVLVKTVRMSHGSGEVGVWGGMGGTFHVADRDAHFYFIKAAVDPQKEVEEGEGDTRPSLITTLLYRPDDPQAQEEAVAKPSYRRRRPDPTPQQEESVASNPWRSRARPDPLLRKRSPPPDACRVPEAPPLSRRRESRDLTSSRKTSTEEYQPSTFSTNRWRSTRPREQEVERRTSPEHYQPSTFSTNRWRARPKEEEKVEVEKKPSSEDYRPSSFSTNRWSSTTAPSSSQGKGEAARGAAEESRWRPRPPLPEKKDTPYGSRLYSKPEEPASPASHPFLRRRESKDATEVPFYLRRPSTHQDDARTSSLSSSSATYRRAAADDSRGSRFLRSTTPSSSLSSRPSLSRFGGTSGGTSGTSGSSYLSRYGSGGAAPPTVASIYPALAKRYDTGASFASRYSIEDSPRGGSGGAAGGSTGRQARRYGSSTTATDLSLPATRTPAARTSSAAALTALAPDPPSRYGASSSSSSSSRLPPASTRAGGSGSGASKYSGTGTSSYGGGNTSSYGGGNTSRYGGTGTSRYSSAGRYTSPAPATPGRTSRYSSPAPSTTRYTSPAPTTIGRTSRYSSPAPGTRGKY